MIKLSEPWRRALGKIKEVTAPHGEYRVHMIIALSFLAGEIGEKNELQYRRILQRYAKMLLNKKSP